MSGAANVALVTREFPDATPSSDAFRSCATLPSAPRAMRTVLMLAQPPALSRSPCTVIGVPPSTGPAAG